MEAPELMIQYWLALQGFGSQLGGSGVVTFCETTEIYKTRIPLELSTCDIDVI